MQQNQRYHILYVIKSSFSNPGDYITHDATHIQRPLEPEKGFILLFHRCSSFHQDL